MFVSVDFFFLLLEFRTLGIFLFKKLIGDRKENPNVCGLEASKFDVFKEKFVGARFFVGG